MTSAIEEGQTLRFLKGTYTLSGATSIEFTKSINIECEEGVIFDATACTASPVFSFAGSFGTWYLLGASPTAKDRTITVHADLAATISKGDILYISTNTTYGGSGEQWSAARSYYYKGEFVKVQAVSGTTVTLTDGLYDDYTAANTVVCKMSGIKVKIKGMVLIGTPLTTQYGLLVSTTEKAVIEDCKVSGFTYSISVASTYQFSVNRCTVADCYVSGLDGYGIVTGSSQNGTISNNIVAGGTHGITHGGTTPCRNIKIYGNTCNTNSASLTGSIECHENSEYFDIFNNTCERIVTAGRNINIKNNNVIRNSSGSAPGIIYSPTKSPCLFVNITGNTIDAYLGTAGTDGIQLRSTYLNGMNIYNLIIKDNIIHCKRTAIEIYSSAKTTYVIDRCIIEGNEILADGTSGRGILAYQSTAGLSCGITDMIISNNIIVAGYSAIDIGSNGYAVTKVDILNNTVKVSTGNTQVIFIRNGTTANVIGNYTQSNNSGTAGYNLVSVSGVIRFINNTVVKMRLAGYNFTAALIIINGTVYSDTDTSSPSLTGQKINEITQSGNYVTYATAAPAASAWAIGDRCINTAPSVGQPKGWICTVAGTPGTWVSEGNL
jgi:hypothetical protein